MNLINHITQYDPEAHAHAAYEARLASFRAEEHTRREAAQQGARPSVANRIARESAEKAYFDTYMRHMGAQNIVG